MSKPVKELVNKTWAKSAKKILTAYAPDTTTLFARLLTAHNEELQKLKSQTAVDRFNLGLQTLKNGITYGWAFGINQQQVRFTRPAKNSANRRVNALLPIAIAAGEAIGKDQATRIVKAHGIPKEGAIPMRHTHAETATA